MRHLCQRKNNYIVLNSHYMDINFGDFSMKLFKHKRLTHQVIFVAVAILVIWLVNTTVSNSPPTPEEKVVANIPENNPLLEDVDLMVWARDAALASFTYQPQALHTSINGCANYYTQEGWKNFYTALRASHNLDAIRDKHYTVTAKSLQSPQILDRGVDGNVYSWRVQLPVEVQWHSTSGDITQKLMVTMKVRRTNKPMDYSGPGVAIEKFIAIPVATNSESSIQQLAKL